MKTIRLNRLPEAIRHELFETRHRRGWSQAELGKRVGLPQMHISGIERGKVVPRFDTLLDLVRVLGWDLLMVPRELVPAVQSLIRDCQNDRGDDGNRPLYAIDPDSEDERNED